MSSILRGAFSVADSQPSSIVFLIDPNPYCSLRCNAYSDSLPVSSAVGSEKSSFSAPASTVWTPPKPLQSLDVNIEPMEFDTIPYSTSLVPPSVLPDIEVGMLTSPVPTSSVSCYTDSFEDQEFAALVKENEAIEALERTSADTRKQLSS